MFTVVGYEEKGLNGWCCGPKGSGSATTASRAPLKHVEKLVRGRKETIIGYVRTARLADVQLLPAPAACADGPPWERVAPSA